jgi:hypothetical protein
LSDIFISYAREDRAVAETLAGELAGAGWSVWWDGEILGGARWDEVINAELQSARCVVVLWSGKSVGKEWVRNEARVGLKRGVLLPVLVDGAAIPVEFASRHAVTLDDVVEHIRRRLAPAACDGAAEQRYLQRVIDAARELAQRYSPLQGIAESRHRIGESLEVLFGKSHRGIELLRHARRGKAPEVEKLGEYPDILEAFAKVRRAALLGAPGSGKSTTLRKLAASLAKEALENRGAPLPVLATLGDWTGTESLVQFLGRCAPEIGPMESRARDGGVVLLLDGLNEVPTATRKAKAREVIQLCERLDPKVAVFVSCRKEDYTGDLDLGLDTLSLEPLTPQRIRTAVRQWIAVLGKTADVADRFFWQLAGDERLAAVLAKWEAAGASESDFWSARDPKDHEAVYEDHGGRGQTLAAAYTLIRAA